MWTYPPTTSLLQGSHHTTSSTTSHGAALRSGKRYIALMAYRPNLDTFTTLASFPFWLEVMPLALSEPKPTPLPHSGPPNEPVYSPSTDYLSPQMSANRRISWQGDNQRRPKRFSFQSDGSRSLSGSPGTANDNPAGFGWQLQAVPQRPIVQRSATSPSLGPTHVPQQQDMPSPQAMEVTPLPPLEAIEDIPEDGPLFRAHCKSMEERAYYLRRSLKRLVRSAEAVAHAGQLLDEAEDAFDVSLHEILENSPNSIRALSDAYWDSARRVQGFARKESLLRLQELIVEPLRRLITILKAAETKKKAYDQESKAFYEHVQRVSRGNLTFDLGSCSSSISASSRTYLLQMVKSVHPRRMRSTKPKRTALQ